MELEETLDWYIGPQLRTVPGHRRGEQLRRRGQAVPGRPRPEAPAGRRAVGRRGGPRARADQRQRRRRLHRAQPRAVRDRHRRPGDEPRRSASRVVVGATPQGVPITVATVGDVRFGPRLRRGAATKDGKGEVVVGVALMLMGENARAVTERVKAQARGAAADAAAGHRASSRSTTAPSWSTAPSRRSATNLVEGAVLVILVLFVLLGDLRAGLIVAATIPLSMLFAIIVMNATGASGQPDEPRRHRLRPHRRRRGHHRRERGAAPRRGARSQADARSTPRSGSTIVEDAAVEVRSASVFGEVDHRHRLRADPRAARHRGEAVPADGEDGALRAARRVHPLAHAGAGARELLSCRPARRSARPG